MSRKSKFHQNPTRITGTIHEDVFTFMKISRSILLRMRNVLDNSYRQNQNTPLVFNNFPPPPEYRAVYEIMSKNMVKPEGPQITSQYGAYELHAG
jgi:hypothetical protein